jgi:hypothetical protein
MEEKNMTNILLPSVPSQDLNPGVPCVQGPSICGEWRRFFRSRMLPVPVSTSRNPI